MTDLPPDETKEHLLYNDNNICGICHNHLRDGVITYCGCYYCRPCIKKYLGEKGAYCPGLKTECKREILNDDKDVFTIVTVIGPPTDSKTKKIPKVKQDVINNAKINDAYKEKGRNNDNQSKRPGNLPTELIKTRWRMMICIFGLAILCVFLLISIISFLVFVHHLKCEPAKDIHVANETESKNFKLTELENCKINVIRKDRELKLSRRKSKTTLKERDEKFQLLREQCQKANATFQANLLDKDKQLRDLKKASIKTEKKLKDKVSRTTAELKATKEKYAQTIFELKNSLEKREKTLRLLLRDGIVDLDFNYPIKKTAMWLRSSIPIISVSMTYVISRGYYLD